MRITSGLLNLGMEGYLRVRRIRQRVRDRFYVTLQNLSLSTWFRSLDAK